MIDSELDKIQRLKEVRTTLGITQREMADALGLQPANLSAIEAGKRSIPSRVTTEVCKIFGINTEWFETGKGEMLAARDMPLEEQLAESKARLARLKKLSATMKVRDMGQLSYPYESDERFIDLNDGNYLMLIPLVNEYAYAGYLSGYKDPEFIDELPKHTIIVSKYHKGNYRAFAISGESMENYETPALSRESIPHGSIASAREIKKDLWRSKFHTHRFQDYIIVHRTEGIICKRIIDQKVDEGIITVHSLNPDKQKYPDHDIYLDDVEQIFNIVNISIPR